MPIYEYQCEKCGEIFEVFQKVSDPPPKRHECGGRKIKRLMSQTSFILKGTGWYVTDYARKEQSQKESRGKKTSERAEKSETNAEKSETNAEKSEKKAEKSEKKAEKSEKKESKKSSDGGSKAAA